MAAFNKHIIIAGSARSGTSWLSELLARQFRYRLLFEPEHEFNTARGQLLCDRLITQKEQAPEAHSYLEKVFANRVDNNWIAQHSNRKFKRHLWPLIPKKFIIKFVRCNLSAKYMNEAFGIPVLHIIRDPYEVIHSQQRVRFPWLYDLSRFQVQDELVAIVKEHFGLDIRETGGFSETERLCLRWCLENVVPLMVMPPRSETYKQVRYESLRNNIELYFDLCKQFQLEPAGRIEEYFTQPSSKTHPGSQIITGTVEKKPWVPSEKQKIERLLAIFKITEYDTFLK